VGQKGYVNDSTTLLSDTTTLDTIRRFLSSDKPADITPLDILQMIHFMTCKAEDHDTFYSQQTLARMFNVNVRSIARSQQRLASANIDWLARPQRRGKPNAVSIKFQNVPAEEILRLKITAEAQQIAVRYQIALQKLGRKKFPAQWLKQQFPSAQRIINDCGGDIELAARMIGHALHNPQHSRKAKKGLYHLYGRWRKVLKTYAEQQKLRQDAELRTQKVSQVAQTEVA
jgi:hypothetical protein